MQYYQLFTPYCEFRIKQGRGGWNLWAYIPEPERLEKFPSPEKAAIAVKIGKTGLPGWDNSELRESEIESESLSSLDDWTKVI